MPATTRSSRCGWRRPTGPSAGSSPRTTGRSRPGCCSRSSSAPTSASLAGRGGPRRRLVSVVLDDPAPVMWGGELVVRDGAAAGQVTSAAWGETLGASVGLAYLRRPGGEVVTAGYAREGRYQVDIG